MVLLFVRLIYYSPCEQQSCRIMSLVIPIFIEMCIGYFRFNKAGYEIDIGLKFKYVVVYCIPL